MWFRYDQNNSGGFWQDDMPRELWVEADSAEEANRLAEEQGVYFDPQCLQDCECCGPRWTEQGCPEGDDLFPSPMIPVFGGGPEETARICYGGREPQVVSFYVQRTVR